ncbi:HEAT repeat domain-containing protein [Archangium violaceum]|uniref:HEAT repeat domain-containing protein n=1 Tax=Archangium violaceum TaxID=83451 RepID=UPI00195154D0|nr:HEAT repeat domain-containing protein [Archangium violaceum]QRO01269.1 HEAT repeat domain-containing protein [Archangium violaceum]
MRGRDVLPLLLAACVALGGIARAAPATSEHGESPEVIQGLLAALDDPDDEVVATALVMLVDPSLPTHPDLQKRLESFLQQPRLKEALETRRGTLWKAAILARATLGLASPDEIPFLIEWLENPFTLKDHALGTNVSDVAARALGSMGEAARAYLPRLVEMLDDPGVQWKAARALGNMGEVARAYLPRLAELLEDPGARGPAALALGSMGEAARAYVPRLGELLKDPDPEVRRTSALALGNMGEAARAYVPRLGELLKDPDPGVRRESALALGNMGEAARAYVPRLVGLLKDPDALVPDEAARALANMAEFSRAQAPRIGELLRDPDPRIRAAAALALENMREAARPYLPRLFELIKDPDPGVHGAAAQTLGRMGENATAYVRQLGMLLNAREPGVAGAAALALGHIGSAARKEAPHLIPLLESNDGETRMRASDALVAMAPLPMEHIAALVVLAEKDSTTLPLGLVQAYMAGGGDPQVERALRWLGGDGRQTPQELSPEEAYETLRAFHELWPATSQYPDLGEELARQIAQVVYLNRGKWTVEGRALIAQLEEQLRSAQLKQADELQAELRTLERGRWLKKFAWSWAGHAGFWMLLIFFYPRSPQVQAIFFWNPWVRRILGFGYVGLLLTWVPFLRRRLLAPFHDLLLADADLEHFQVEAYFDRSEVLIASTGQRELLLKALPSLRGQVVLEGASGLGKSMFIKYLLRTSKHLSVYLTAQRCKEGVLEAIQAKLEGHARDTTFLQSIIYSGALDIYIDGLNEVAADTRARIVQFVEPKFHGDILLATQRMEWTPPVTARLYELQPLSEERLSEFLLGRAPLLGARARPRGEASYREACEHFLKRALSPEQPGELRQAMLEVLSNPMDLTVVARMLSEGHSPDLFHLRRQQYELMARDYQAVNLAEFPLEALSEEAYQMRKEDRSAISEEKFGKELLRMEAFKMVVRREWRGAEGMQGREWHFRHDKIQCFFIAQTFLGPDNPRIIEHMEDPRFRGVYFLLTELLEPGNAKELQDHLVEHAAETRDHTVSDEFVNLLKARRHAERVRDGA